MFADVAPLVRLPPTLGVFTYRIPERNEPRVVRGSYVRIPFRRRSLWGITVHTFTTPPTLPDRAPPMRDLLDVRDDLVLTDVEVHAVEATAAAMHVSIATAAYLTQPVPCVRQDVSRARIAPAFPRRMSKIPPEPEWVVKLLNHRSFTIALALTFTQRCDAIRAVARATLARGQSVLVITPYRVWFNALAHALHDIGPVVVLDRRDSRSVFWSSVIRARAPGTICIGTRAAAYIAPTTLGAIVIDLGDADDHKQWDTEPKFDARTVTAATAAALGISRLLIAAAPRVEDWATATSRLDFRDPPHIPPPVTEDLRAYWRGGGRGLLTPACTARITRDAVAGCTTLLVHNRKGRMRRLACAECHTTLTCATCGALVPDDASVIRCTTCRIPLPERERCTACGSTRLRGSVVGTAGIVEELHGMHPNLRIARVDRDSSAMPEGSPNVIVASQRFFTSFAPAYGGRIGTIILLHAERYARSDDFRSHEHRYRALQQIVGWGRTWRADVLIQSSDSSSLMDALDFAHPEIWYRAEIAERAALGYPPAVRLLRLDTDDVSAAQEAQGLCDLIAARFHAMIIGVDGPYPFGRVRTRLRTSMVLRVRPSITQNEIATIAAMLPEGWQIDLDPLELHATTYAQDATRYHHASQ